MDGDIGGGCPFAHGGNTSTEKPVTKWWPNSLNLDILHQHGARTNPMDPDYNPVSYTHLTLPTICSV